MRKSFLFLLSAMLLIGEIGRGEAYNTATVFAPAVTGAVSETDTIIASDIGNLKKLYDLRGLIKDIPDNMIAGIKFDKLRRLYVATYGHGKFEAWINTKKPVYRVESDGKVSLFADIQCGILGILGIDEANSVYVTTTNDMNAVNGTGILKITEDGNTKVFATGFQQPCSGIFDHAGNMYLVEAQQNKIYKLTPQGEKSVILDINLSSLAAGLLFHGMAFDSTFSTCYLVGYSAGTGRVLKCSLSKDWKFGPLELICQLPSPNFVWVDLSGNAFVTYGESRIAKITPDGKTQLLYNVLYNKMLDDFDGKMYIVSKDCQLYMIMENEDSTEDNDDQPINLAPRIIEFSVERDSLSYGGYVARGLVEDETDCSVNLFLLHDGDSTRVPLERDSLDSALYCLPFEGYAWGDSLSAWLEIVDNQGLNAVSDTLDFCFIPLVAGDLDSDGGVDVFDLLAMLRALSGSEQPSAEARCTGDLDRNGKINVFDMLAMLKLLAASQ